MNDHTTYMKKAREHIEHKLITIEMMKELIMKVLCNMEDLVCIKLINIKLIIYI